MIQAYFADSNDTVIANKNHQFIDGIRKQALEHDGFSVATNASSADIVVIDHEYQYRTRHYAETLDACDFLKSHTCKIHVINHDTYARVFFPGLYTSLEKSKTPLFPARSIPYKWNLWKFPVSPDGGWSPEYLSGFRGADTTHPLRVKIISKLASHEEFNVKILRKTLHEHSEQDQQDFIDHLLSLKFSLCPRGLSPSSYRVYESMELGRCPVIISDAWVPPDDIDWASCSVRIAESELHRIPEILKEKANQAKELGQNAHEIWKEKLDFPARYQYFLNQLYLLVMDTNSDFQMSYSDFQNKWSGKEMYKLYDWTFLGRIKSRIQKYRQTFYYR